MNKNEEARLTQHYAVLAGYYRLQLADMVLKMYAADLADLDFNQVMAAFEAYRKNKKNRFLPMPADIRDLIDPLVDADSAAKEIAARICGAIPKFGYNLAEQAKNYVGEVGWQIVLDLGGWSYVCERMGSSIDPTAFQAQARDLARSRLTHSHTSLAKVIGLSSSKPRGELESSASILNSIKQIIEKKQP